MATLLVYKTKLDLAQVGKTGTVIEVHPESVHYQGNSKRNMSVYELQSYCLNEICRCGNYRTFPGIEQKLTSCVNKDMDVANIMYIKKSVQLLVNSRAEHYSKKPHACHV